jgi:methylphosphotriester-DNA--protein-cysteine methyltransferase
MKKMYTLLTPNGPARSETPGALGGHKGTKVYGRMDCPAALRALAKNGGLTYKKSRVFFQDEATAIACGFRPCGACMTAEYKAWKAKRPA